MMDATAIKHRWLPISLTAFMLLTTTNIFYQASKQLPEKVPVVEMAELVQDLEEEVRKSAENSPESDAAQTNLTETVNDLTIPKIAKAGLTSFEAYRQKPIPVEQGFAPIGLIIEDMGLSDPILDIVLRGLPDSTGLAFNPYAPDINPSLNMARQQGLEIFLSLPLQPATDSNRDAGNKSLKITYDAERNRELLYWNMAQGAQYIGFVSMFGDGFIPDNKAFGGVLKELSERGLSFINNTNQPASAETTKLLQKIKLPYANSLEVGTALSKTGLQQQLDTVVKVAKANDGAVVVVKPYPIVLKMLQEWLKTLPEQELQLVPASQLMNPS